MMVVMMMTESATALFQMKMPATQVANTVNVMTMTSLYPKISVRKPKKGLA